MVNPGVWRLDARGIGGSGLGYIDLPGGGIGINETVQAIVELDFTTNTVTGSLVRSAGTISQTLSMNPTMALGLQSVRLAVNDADGSEVGFHLPSVHVALGSSDARGV